MRAPLRNVAGQGAWYALGNALGKLSGLVLLPLYTNTTFLSAASFGLWGTFEVTVTICVGVVGLQLAVGLLRFDADAGVNGRAAPTAWWLTAALALAAALPALGVVMLAVAPSVRPVYLGLVLYTFSEILLTIPMALLRARGRAGRFTGMVVLKLLLVIGLNLLLLRAWRLDLLGLVWANAGASVATLLAALAAASPGELLFGGVDRALGRRMVRFSAPLVLAGIGSMALNAGDRYVLLLYRSEAEVGLYTLAAKFGGLVNMLAAQPLQLALLPVLFRLPRAEQPAFAGRLVRYLAVMFGLLTVGLSLFTGPVLHLIRSDVFYADAVGLVPWIALGFAAFGIGIVFDGLLTLSERTGVISGWIAVAAVLNIGANLIVVPWLGALGAALTTLGSYLVLLAGKWWSVRRTIAVPVARGPMASLVLVTVAVAVGAAVAPLPGGPTGWLLGVGVAAGYAGLTLLLGWLPPDDVRALARLLAPAKPPG